MNWVITSSILIVIILVIRFLLKGKISLRLQYGLWLLVLVRLLVPFSFGETVMSIHNWLDSLADTKEVQQIEELTQSRLPSMSYNEAYDIVEEQYAQNGVDINHIPIEEFSETIEYEILDTMNNGYTPEEIVKMIWMAGMLILTLWFVYTNIRFAGKLRKNRVLLGTVGELLGRNNDKDHFSGDLLQVYESDSIETPCLYGLVSPAIYVTSEVSEQEKILRHVLEHECTHYHHKDENWSLLRVICLVFHWYNPLVWYAAILSRNDAELACDEATIERLGEVERAEYGRTLINLTCEKRVQVLITATTMTGSAQSIKERIELIAKKPKMAVFTIVILVLLVQLILGVIFTGAKPEYASFSEWADELVVDKMEWVQVSKGVGPEKLSYSLSEEEVEQFCRLLESIPEEKCYRRGEFVAEYEEYRIMFMYAGKDMGFKCLEDGTVQLLPHTELPEFTPEGKVLVIDSPELWNYIVDTVDTEGQNLSIDAEESTEVECCIYETFADLNHDGKEDLIKLVTTAQPGRWWQDLDYNGVYVQVFLAESDGTYNINPVYTSELVSASHGANGTFVLTEKDGRDFLLYSLTHEAQGFAYYTYSVMCIEGNEMVTVMTDTVNFYCDPYQSVYWENGPRREDVIPRFKAGIEPWIENGTMLISYDVSAPTFVSQYGVNVPASSYYDIVWARNESE